MKQKRIAVIAITCLLVALSTASIVYTQQEQRARTGALPYGWHIDGRGRVAPVVDGEEGRKERFLLAPADSPRLTMPIMPNGKPATGFWAGGGETYARDDEGHEYRRGSFGWIPTGR